MCTESLGRRWESHSVYAMPNKDIRTVPGLALRLRFPFVTSVWACGRYGYLSAMFVHHFSLLYCRSSNSLVSFLLQQCPSFGQWRRCRNRTKGGHGHSGERCFCGKFGKTQDHDEDRVYCDHPPIQDHDQHGYYPINSDFYSHVIGDSFKDCNTWALRGFQAVCI